MAASSAKLDDQAATAATAALYVTNSDQQRFSDNNQKFNLAGVVHSLKHTKPRDLPIFSSAGLKKADSVASTAASFGWASQKPFEHWKPSASALTSASKAAMLAKDYKGPALWQPKQSASGAKAAVIAARASGKHEASKLEASVWGNCAANQAFRSERNGYLSPQIGSGKSSGLGRQNSLIAATDAMASCRKRSDSTPIPGPAYPDEANITVNALSATAHANRPFRNSETGFPPESVATPFINLPREMLTSHPPVKLEADEKNRADFLSASPVAMAKQMYNMQQKQIDETSKAPRDDIKSAASSAHDRLPSTSTADDNILPVRFNNLQEAAQKLAQERLAKLHNKHVQDYKYYDYYGNSPRQKSRLSIRGRRRACSEGSLKDKKQSEKTRAQMSSSLSQVDARKRRLDRDALIAVARRNVAASLQDIDQRILKDTGKVAPSVLTEWEAKAHAAAQKNSESRMENYGKASIRGGNFINQSMIKEVAARNVQPALDEINEKAKQKRVRQAEFKLEQEAAKREAETKRARENEIKDVNQKLKEQDKEEEKTRKEGEKVAKAQQTHPAKEEKQKCREVLSTQEAIVAALDVAPIETGIKVVTESQEKASGIDPPASVAYVAPSSLRTSMELRSQERLNVVISPAAEGIKGVKNWLRVKFGRRTSKCQNSEVKDNNATNDKAFAGGASANNGEPRNTSLKDIALAGRIYGEAETETDEDKTGRSSSRASSVSSLSAFDSQNELAREISMR